MYRPENLRWLAELTDRLSQALPLLDHTECERLARGFIGVNAVCDLTSFLCDGLQSRAGYVVSPSLTYADLRPHLCQRPPQPASAKDLSPLVGVDAVWQMSSPPFDADPWRCINVWLAREALLRSSSVAESCTAQRIARKLFDETLSGSGLDPAPCHARNQAVGSAFDGWWEAWTGRLRDLILAVIPDRICPIQDPNDQRRELAQLLAHELPDAPLIQLVGHKNNQLSGCIGQLNKGIALSASRSWIGDLSRRLLDCVESAEDLILNSVDVAGLKAFLEEIHRAGPGGWAMPLPGGLPATRLWRLAQMGMATETVAACYVPEIVKEWKWVERMARMRGVARPWSSSRPVADLFFWPLPIRLGSWERNVRTYGL